MHFRKHLLYYIVSIMIFVVGLALIFFTAYDQRLQLSFVIMTSMIYFLWSFVHHYVHHELHTKVVVEYILIATLGIALSFMLFSV